MLLVLSYLWALEAPDYERVPIPTVWWYLDVLDYLPEAFTQMCLPKVGEGFDSPKLSIRAIGEISPWACSKFSRGKGLFEVVFIFNFIYTEPKHSDMLL